MLVEKKIYEKLNSAYFVRKPKVFNSEHNERERGRAREKGVRERE